MIKSLFNIAKKMCNFCELFSGMGGGRMGALTSVLWSRQSGVVKAFPISAGSLWGGERAGL